MGRIRTIVGVSVCALLALLLVVIFIVGANVWTVNRQKADAFLVNLAGRQRMLSQRLTKEALLYAFTEQERWARKLQETVRLFEEGLRILKQGDPSRKISPPSEARFREELAKLEKLWQPFRASVETILRSGVPMEEELRALDYLLANNEALLRQAHAVTEELTRIAEGKLRYLLRFQMIMLVVGMVVFGLTFFLLRRLVLRPLEDSVKALERAARGHFDRALPEARLRELAVLNRAYNSLTSTMGMQLLSVQASGKALEKASRVVTQGGESLQEEARRLNEMAAEVVSAAQAAEESLSGVNQAVSEMSVATNEIAQGITVTANKATEAKERTELAAQKIKHLGERSGEIGNIIQMIRQIAEQTNLLALNATIEAARAGEAGKGFAVVANEVKELAKQTASATEDITRVIEEIQADIQASVAAIEEITGAIAEVNDLSTTIANAAEEQTAMVGEIRQNVEQGLQSTITVRDRSQHLKQAAENLDQLRDRLEISRKSVGLITRQLQDVARQVKVSPGMLEEAMSRAEMSARLRALINSHYRWRNLLLEAVIEYRPPEVEMDPTRCQLGKFLAHYTPSREEEAVLAELREVHAKLHRSAEEIARMMAEKQPHENIFAYFESTVQGLLERTAELLLRWQSLVEGRHEKN